MSKFVPVDLVVRNLSSPDRTVTGQYWHCDEPGCGEAIDPATSKPILCGQCNHSLENIEDYAIPRRLGQEPLRAVAFSVLLSNSNVWKNDPEFCGHVHQSVINAEQCARKMLEESPDGIATRVVALQVMP